MTTDPDAGHAFDALHALDALDVGDAVDQCVAGSRLLGADPTLPQDQLEYMAEAQSGLMITLLVGQGVLIEQGDEYVSSIQYTDGTVTLNGNVLPFGLP